MELATLWFHPQHGAMISVEPHARIFAYRGSHRDEWREVMKLRMTRNERGYQVPSPGQQLPKGFLWADPSRQSHGMGGPELVYGPLSMVCRECKEPFVFPAHAQKHLYEEIGRYLDTRAVRCLTCGRRHARLQRARIAHAEALGALEVNPVAASYLEAARAALELLEAGGRTRLDRAIGQARRARLLGARAAEKLEQRLRERLGAPAASR